MCGHILASRPPSSLKRSRSRRPPRERRDAVAIDRTGEDRHGAAVRSLGARDRSGHRRRAAPGRLVAAGGGRAGRTAWRQPATVRMAMRQLQDLGLISRRKRAGTRVEASRPQAGYAPVAGNDRGPDPLRRRGQASRSGRSTRSWPTTSSRHAWAVKPGQRWVRRHHHAQRPAAARAADLLDDRLSSTRPMATLSGGRCTRARSSSRRSSSRRTAPTSPRSARKSVRSASRPRSPASLGCEPEAPALEITRHYRDHAGRVFEITVSVQPAERFSYALKLRRRANGGPAAS